MTSLLDAEGNPLHSNEENEWDWVVVAFHEWLEDVRLREIILARHHLSRPQMLVLRKLVEGAFRHNIRMNERDLRTHLLNFLRDRVVRMSLVRVVLRSEADSRKTYDEICERFPARFAHWEGQPEDTRGPAPELPDAPVDPRTRAEVMADLQKIREQLESLAIRDSLSIKEA